MRVSELISMDIMREWKDGDIISITAGTGMGKSYWCRNQLYTLAKSENKKILMLVNRNRIKSQFHMELEECNKLDDTITLVTYQKIEHTILRRDKELDLSEFDYIVCDECHYFFIDADFNNFTDLSLSEILKTKAVKIFMSATSKTMLEYLGGVTKKEIQSFNLIKESGIETLCFYNKNDSLFHLAKGLIESNSKAIFFIGSAEKAYDLYEMYKDNATFCCGKSSKYYQYVDQETIDTMLKEERFNTNLLITTTALDCGITIKDKDMKFIFLNGIFDIETIIQCIGRKRIIDNTDKPMVYINQFSNEQIGGMKSKINQKIEKALYFKEHGLVEYLLEYPRQYDNEMIIYDIPSENKSRCEKKLNELMLLKRQKKILAIDTMLLYKKNGFARYVSKELGFECNYYILEEENVKTQLEYYLEQHHGEIMLTPKDRKELIEKIHVTDDRGRLLKSITALNACLEEINSEFRIVTLPKITKTIEGKKKQFKTPWQLRKLT